MKIDFRSQIKKRMAELDIPTSYALTKFIHHKITQQAVDNYLSGKSEMTAANLEVILYALGGQLTFK